MITDRILQIIEKQGTTKYKVLKDLGLSTAFLDKPREITTDKYANILSYFPDVNPQWLLTGIGSMFLNNTAKATLSTPDIVESIPLIPIEALAGIGTENDVQILDYECERYLVPILKDAEFLIGVKGSSMYPKYSSGDIVACKRVKDIVFFQWGKVYVIDSLSQGVLIKRIFKSSDDNSVIIHSDNTERYPDFLLPISEIRALALVVGVIRVE